MFVMVCLIVLIMADGVNAGSIRWKWGAAWSNYDLPGKDYKNFEVKNGGFPVCMDACAKDEKCRAYTFVPSGPRGRAARCYLKYDLPEYVGKSMSNYVSGHKIYLCGEFSFTTKSPLPPAVIGGHYNYQINVSGGIKPIEFCPMRKDLRGAAPRCDNSPDQNFSMPHGLKLSKTGLISGQVKCGPGSDLSKCKEMYIPILIKVKDSCPNDPRSITGEFWIHIKNPATSGN
jgi:hypothetical protein